jgi:DNA polymerase-3 subunit chi
MMAEPDGAGPTAAVTRRVDFYLLARDPVERVTALLAGKAIAAGNRVLVIAAADRHDALSRALWEADGFLAHGRANEKDAARQPILLSDACEAPNGAQVAIIADGEWRGGADGCARSLLLFNASQTEQARGLWRELSRLDDTECRFFRQGDDGNWGRAG